MIEETISTEAAQKFYDKLGAGHDAAEFYEGRAKQRGLQLLNLQPGERALNVGAGTGKEHALIRQAVEPGGAAFGLDLSPVMLRLARERTGSPLCRANAARLPYPDGAFDALFSSYMLDLIPIRTLPVLMAEFYRVLKPGGRLALVSLTDGVDPASWLLVAAWKTAYAVSPSACGGCRPVQLSGLVQAAGFAGMQRQVIVQLAVPSEVITGQKPME